MRRFEAHQTRNPSGLTNDREIGIVDRLKNHHLVAGFDDREDRARQRFGAA